MIKGVGTDIVEVARIRRSIEKNIGFRTLVFAEEEIDYCSQQGRKYQSYAARFAAKEAFFKALGTGWRGNMAFHEVVVVNDAQGKPSLQLKGETRKYLEVQGAYILHISISHTAAYATATVIIENKP